MSDNETILMLPPTPGTDTAHPRFEINWRGSARMDASVGNESYKEICQVKGNIIAAAAIAHYWRKEYEIAESFIDDGCICVMAIERSLQCAKQHDMWSKIASGSRDFDNSKIAAYAPRGTK